MLTNTPRVIYGNLPNTGLIANLPQGCCVEVPCLVDGNGVQPTYVGELPPTCAALNRTNINVQELAVKGHQRGDRFLVQSAVALDPLTAAVVPIERIPDMVGELFEAQREWLPQFKE
jgi:alpha-galactosidase